MATETETVTRELVERWIDQLVADRRLWVDGRGTPEHQRVHLHAYRMGAMDLLATLALHRIVSPA